MRRDWAVAFPFRGYRQKAKGTYVGEENHARLRQIPAYLVLLKTGSCQVPYFFAGCLDLAEDDGEVPSAVVEGQIRLVGTST